MERKLVDARRLPWEIRHPKLLTQADLSTAIRFSTARELDPIALAELWQLQQQVMMLEWAVKKAFAGGLR